MLLEHERYYGFCMDAPVTVCCWNTKVIMVFAWMRPSLYALESERYNGLSINAPITVCSWKRNVIVL